MSNIRFSTGNVQGNALSAALGGVGERFNAQPSSGSASAQTHPQRAAGASKTHVKLALFDSLPLGAWFKLYNLVRHTKDESTTHEELPLNVKGFVNCAQIELSNASSVVFVKTGHTTARELLIFGSGDKKWHSLVEPEVVIPGLRSVCAYVNGPTEVSSADGVRIYANYNAE